MAGGMSVADIISEDIVLKFPIQKLEPPCSQETDLFDAAISADPDKIIVKRPLKSEFLAGRKPSYTLSGKAIRYDCYTL